MLLVWILLAGIAFWLGPVGWFGFWALVIVSAALGRKKTPREGEAPKPGTSPIYLYVLIGIFALVGLYARWVIHSAGN